MARSSSTPVERSWPALLLAPLLGLSACHGAGLGLFSRPADALRADAGAYPRPAPGLADASAFPDTAAGFHKRAVTQNAPGLVDYAIDYDDQDPALPSAVTLRFFRPAPGVSLDALFAQERQSILDQHRNVREFGASSDRLGKGGLVYPSRTVRFVFDGPFKDHRSPLYARLIVVELAGRFFILRVTAPDGQQERTDRRTRQLLAAVDWTRAEPVANEPSKSP